MSDRRHWKRNYNCRIWHRTNPEIILKRGTDQRIVFIQKMCSYWWNSGFFFTFYGFLIKKFHMDSKSLWTHYLSGPWYKHLDSFRENTASKSICSWVFWRYDERRKIEEILCFNWTRSLGRIEYDVFVFGCALHSPVGCYDNNLHGSNIYNDLYWSFRTFFLQTRQGFWKIFLSHLILIRWLKNH